MRTGHSSSETHAGPAKLDIVELAVQYGHVTALRSMSLSLEPGTAIAVLGPNGAGKSSLANAVSGLVGSSAKSLLLDGEEIGKLSAYARARRGIGHLPDSRAIFPSLTVNENLKMFFQRRKGATRSDIEKAYELFPPLARRQKLAARKLSGGEQQMLAFSRLVVAPPRLLIVDELSHGLAPGIVASLFKSLEVLKGSTSMIVIEQFVSRAVKLADSVLVLSHGEVQHLGPAADFTTDMAAELYSLHVDRAEGISERDSEPASAE
jgi:branched-chain amino acid transport system ATP-binding protein